MAGRPKKRAASNDWMSVEGDRLMALMPVAANVPMVEKVTVGQQAKKKFTGSMQSMAPATEDTACEIMLCWLQHHMDAITSYIR